MAATDHGDVLARFSNYGATSVDLAAPGVDILSTVPNNGYGEFSGTSMATPHVAGVAALAWALSPASSITQIRDAILDGVDALAALDGRVLSGGRLNARGTLERLGMNVTAHHAGGGRVSAPAADCYLRFRSRTRSIRRRFDASDFLVNGIAASTVTIVDSDTAAFAFATSPVTAEGPQTMQMPQGAVTRAKRRRSASSVAVGVLLRHGGDGGRVVGPRARRDACRRGRRRLCSRSMSRSIPRQSAWKTCNLITGSSSPPRRKRATAARYEVRELIEDGSVKYELKAGAILGCPRQSGRPRMWADSISTIRLSTTIDRPMFRGRSTIWRR